MPCAGVPSKRKHNSSLCSCLEAQPYQLPMGGLLNVHYKLSWLTFILILYSSMKLCSSFWVVCNC